MVVGVCKIDVVMFEAATLKDKRRVVKSIKDRISHRFNVSIAEVAGLDLRQRTTLGMAVVSNDARFAEAQLASAVDLVRRVPNASMVDYSIEVLEGM